MSIDEIESLEDRLKNIRHAKIAERNISQRRKLLEEGDTVFTTKPIWEDYEYIKVPFSLDIEGLNYNIYNKYFIDASSAKWWTKDIMIRLYSSCPMMVPSVEEIDLNIIEIDPKEIFSPNMEYRGKEDIYLYMYSPK